VIRSDRVFREEEQPDLKRRGIMAIISISRGTFSGGKILAERVAERLSYPCLGREEILFEAGKEFGVSERELSEAVNQPPPFWQQVPGRRVAYLMCLTAALLKRAQGGSLVYHGHAGHFLLAGITHVLRIRVIADMEYRIKAAMERMNLTRDEAIVYIERVDRERNRWTRFLYGIEWGDPSQYDVVLNLERMSIEGASLAIVSMTQLDDYKITPQSQKAFENLMVTSGVWAALVKDERTRAASVQVMANNGVVTITGKASTGKVVDAIPVVASQVPGVKEVKNEVGVGSDWYW
jgi:cytidylate kinase